MSWDVVIMKVVAPEEGEPPPLGDAEVVRRAISESLPAVDWSDPAWGVLEGREWSIELNFKAAGPVDSFMLHVRGAGDPLAPIAQLCRDNDWVALDMSTGEYLDPTAPSPQGWQSFQSFRDEIVAMATGRSRSRRLLFWLVGLVVAAGAVALLMKLL